MMVRLLSLLLVLLVPGPAPAAHITDKLVVGLYPEPRAEGQPRQLLSSGTPVEVLRRKDGFAEIRLADERTGWVEASYVTEEKPAKAMLLETQARLRQMGLELARLRGEARTDDGQAEVELTDRVNGADLAAARARITELESALAAARTDDGARQQLAAINDEVRVALQRLAATQGMTLVQAAEDPSDESPLPDYLPWLIAIGMLLLGFAGGVAFIDYRIRRRYGGFRI